MILSLKNLQRQKFLSLDTKLNLYKTHIKSFILNVSDHGPLTKTDEDRPLIFERNISEKYTEN